MAKAKKVPSDERVSTLAERLKEVLTTHNLKQSEIVKLCDPYCKRYGIQIRQNEISQYLHGKVIPGFDKLTIICKALNVSELWLLGYDVNKTNTENIVNLDVSNEEIPLIGEIACGNPIFTDQAAEEYINLKEEINYDFCLRAKGDSMIGDHIKHGDLVFIQKQNMVDNGQIAAVIIEDQATLKRVFYYPEKELFILKASNPNYNDMIYSKFELNSIIILGKVVAFMSYDTSPITLL